MRPLSILSFALVGAASAIAATAQSQPTASGALGMPAQPKVAMPSAVDTAAPGSGADLSPANQAASLKAAIEHCDLAQTLALGGTAEDAARIAVAVNRSRPIVPGTTAWIQANGRAWVAARTLDGNATMLTSPRDFTPPGGVAGLPTLADAFGPNPPFQANPTPLNVDLGQQAQAGANAKDLAKQYLAGISPARPRNNAQADDPDQALFMPMTVGGGTLVALVIPTFSPRGRSGGLNIALPGTEGMVGRADVVSAPPPATEFHVPGWVKDLPPPPPPPPPVTQC